MTEPHIFVVEDDATIAAVLTDYLHHEGYRTTAIANGSNVVAAVRSDCPDLMILDLMLPGADGLAICREVRTFSMLPIIMVTARVDEVDRLLGLEIGADDYVCKPFLPREVVARVKAILRRVRHEEGLQQSQATERAYRGVTLDKERHICLFLGDAIDLTPVEFRLLDALLTRPGRVFSRDQLMDLCYDGHRVVSDRTIDTHVKNLRKKLSAGDEAEPLIHSIYGIGYKLE